MARPVDAEEHGCRNDTADDDSLEVGVLQRAQQVSREREHARDHPRAPLHGLLQPFAFDPVADTIRKIADDAGVIHVTDAWVIELSERFAFAQEPRAGGLIGEEIDPQAHMALEALVECLEEHPHRRGRDDPLQPVPMTQGYPGLLEDEQWLRAGQREPLAAVRSAGRGRTPPPRTSGGFRSEIGRLRRRT